MSISARILLQRCMSARLQTKPQTESESAEFVEIGRGLLLYVCFVKKSSEGSGETGAEASSDAFLETVARRVCQVKMCEGDDGKTISLSDLPGDLLIIPQFTLGGKMKSKAFQYHNTIDKGQCESLYKHFVSACTKILSESSLWKSKGCRVACGTYGNRQVLSTVTNGPYSHFVEF